MFSLILELLIYFRIGANNFLNFLSIGASIQKLNHTENLQNQGSLKIVRRWLANTSRLVYTAWG